MCESLDAGYREIVREKEISLNKLLLIETGTIIELVLEGKIVV